MLRIRSCTTFIVLVTTLLLGCGEVDVVHESATPPASDPTVLSLIDELPTTTTTIAPPTTTTVPMLTEVIDPATHDVEAAVRMAPPGPPCENPLGLYCLPFAPEGLDLCSEMNWYRVQWGIPDRWGDQPRNVAKLYQGRGWRESNCEPWANSHASPGCCFGWWQVASSNITAYGYANAGVFSNCEVFTKRDYWSEKGLVTPLMKQKQACITKALIDYHVARGEDPGWVVWDQWL